MSIKANRRNHNHGADIVFGLDPDTSRPLLSEPTTLSYDSTEEREMRRGGEERDNFFSGNSVHVKLQEKERRGSTASTGGGRFYSEYKKNRPKSDHHHRNSKRVLDRQGYFKQSKGVWNIQRRGGAWLYAPFYWDDWFHSLLNAPTRRIFLLLFVLYILSIVAFAGVYYEISTKGETEEEGGGCGMDIATMVEAYYFSLSTMTTLGYGVSDYYFGDCIKPMIVISVQMFISITFDAVAIGVIFQRLSRVQKRARTIVFSDKAVIRRVRGRLFFMFQLSELRKHQLVEAHVRVYCVRHEREGKNLRARREEEGGGEVGGGTTARKRVDGNRRAQDRYEVDTAYFQTHNVRLQHPDDELGAFLLMALPNVVVHRVDEWSPLCAPPLWYDEKGRRHVWRGMLPPNLETLAPTEELDDEEEDMMYENIQGTTVVRGFPELLQRACDKEADARVLLQTEYGLSRRREAKARFAANVGSEDMGKGLGGKEKLGENNHGRSQSDGDLVVEGEDGNLGLDISSDVGDLEGKGKGGRPPSVPLTPTGTSTSPVPLSRHDSIKPKINIPKSTSKHPYRSSVGVETPKQRAKRKYQASEQREIKAFMKDREAELVVLVEGIDVMTSATLQARHSYRWDDVVWNHGFAPCVDRIPDKDNGNKTEGAVIDFSKFHDLVPVPGDCDSCGLVPNVG